MKTLFEELSHIPDLDPNLRAALNETTRVRADNVYTYMAEDKKDFRAVVEHLPVVIPPFPVTWIEYDLSDQDLKATVGYLIIREKTAEQMILKIPARMITQDSVWTVYAQAFSRGGNVETVLSNGTKTLVHIENGRAPVSFLFTLRENGTIIGDQTGVNVSFSPDYGTALKRNNFFDKSIVAEREIFAVALFALSLLNCKNVTLEAVTPPAMIKHRNRHAQPAVSYHVLKIRPMSVHTRGGGEWHGSGSPSIHIRRGHFKDYREGKGLFGKINGVFWWESEVVGRGPTRVDKEYEIST